MDTYSGGTGTSTTPPVPAPAPHGRASSRASSALAALSILAILLYLLWRFIWQYRKHGTRSSNSIIGAGATAPPPITSSARPPPPPSCPPRDAMAAAYGPPRTTTTTTTSSFPLSSVLVVPVAAAHLGADKVDCAVCLAELGDGGEAGLVPGCGHGFHAECIEAWFRVNSTCPLCRAAVGRGAAEVPRYDSSV